jgi:Tfp pilus assembly protein PilN
MRLDINLATSPYEDARPFYLRAGTALGIAVVLTIILAVMAIHDWRSARGISVQIDRTREQVKDLDRQKDQSEALLRQPANQQINQRAQYVNQKLALRAFSWTRVFTDLEKMMPTRVHLVSINPALQNGQITMTMMVAGDSYDKGLELLRNLEKSSDFRDPQLKATSAQIGPGANPEDSMQFQFTAQYVPENVSPSAAGSATGAGE